MEKTKDVRTVAIPLNLVHEIKAIVSGRLGYVTVAEYVRDAIREKISHDIYQLERMKEREVSESEMQG